MNISHHEAHFRPVGAVCIGWFPGNDPGNGFGDWTLLSVCIPVVWLKSKGVSFSRGVFCCLL